ncbi:MAG: DUF3276 family protein [Paludibacteraceae bacterium]|nr:DUF3276 family protein [Paludibacteraceae bacterium]
MESERNYFEQERKDSEIVYSKSIKAGKRIYYLDVKRSRNDDLYLAITESKKKVTGVGEGAQITIEKHKIFLYKEDFQSFTDGLEDVIGFIKSQVGEIEPRPAFVPKEETATFVEAPQDEDDEDKSEEKKGFFSKFF